MLTAFIFALLFPHHVHGLNNPTVFINGRPIRTSAQPVILDGRTLIPLRDTAEALEADVFWDARRKTAVVARHLNVVAITPGSTLAYVNGKKQKMDVAPRIMDGHLYIPLRFLADSLGVGVGWDVVERAVVITDPALTVPHNQPALIQYMNAIYRWSELQDYQASLVWAEHYPGVGGGQFTGRLNFYSRGSGRNMLERVSLDGVFASTSKGRKTRSDNVKGIWTEGDVEYFKIGNKDWQIRQPIRPLYDRGALALYAGTVLARSDQTVRAWRTSMDNGMQVLHVVFAPDFRIFGLRTGLDLLNKADQIGFTRDSLILDREGNIQAFERRRRVFQNGTFGEQVEILVGIRPGTGRFVEPPSPRK